MLQNAALHDSVEGFRRAGRIDKNYKVRGVEKEALAYEKCEI